MAASLTSCSLAGTTLVRRATHSRRVAPRNVVRAALETQRYATPYDGYK
jgi:hypothetical protein